MRLSAHDCVSGRAWGPLFPPTLRKMLEYRGRMPLPQHFSKRI